LLKIIKIFEIVYFFIKNYINSYNTFLFMTSDIEYPDEELNKKILSNLEIPNISLIDLFRNSAKDNNDKNALYFKGKLKSYKTALEEINRLAYSFKKLGLEKGDRIAVLLPNCPQFYITFFAAQSIGVIFTSINPLYSAAEISNILSDCKPKMIVTLRMFAKKIREVEKQIKIDNVVITSVSEELPIIKKILYKFLKAYSQTKIPNEISYRNLIENGKNQNSNTKINPEEDIAVLQYTGGTTGIPKGAMLSHKNLVSQVLVLNYWENHLEKQPKGQYKIAGILPYSHIFGLTSSFLWPVYEGALIFLVPDPRKLLEVLKIINKHGLHFLYCVPIFFRKLASHKKIHKFNLSSLLLAVSGGESLPGDTVKIFEDKTNCLLVEGYGLTEASPVTHINPPNKKNRLVGSIGITIPNTSAKIVDPKTGKTITRVDKDGELWVSGPGVMKGYWNNNEETKITLKDGWLRTGDIAKIDKNGYFTIVDRLKDVIIVSGYNVWPSEVESVLINHPFIADVGVIGHDNGSGTVVKAVLVKKQGCKELSLNEIRSYCKKSLAPYKVPKIIEYRDDLPRSSVGKVLRRKLRENQ